MKDKNKSTVGIDVVEYLNNYLSNSIRESELICYTVPDTEQITSDRIVISADPISDYSNDLVDKTYGYSNIIFENSFEYQYQKYRTMMYGGDDALTKRKKRIDNLYK